MTVSWLKVFSFCPKLKQAVSSCKQRVVADITERDLTIMSSKQRHV